jgi:acyl-coenzyme A synthetase/AMP-(fatty) acid ligase
MLESGIKHELKVIRSAGEPIHAEDLHRIEQVFGENCILINWIASSETSVAVSYAKCGDTTALAQLGRGKILDELDVKVVDPNNNPLPQGQIGEIVVSSAYLFSGYWNQPQLSRSVLTQHPSKPGFKTFHTGDLGRFDSSGRIEFVSRKDELLKVCGYRVEASEVESSLRKLSGVLDATVTVRSDLKVGSELVAHLEVRDLSILPPVAETRRILEQSLPRYMIPSLFLVLERLPRGPTGKVLRRMLVVLPNARRDRYNVTQVTYKRDNL